MQDSIIVYRNPLEKMFWEGNGIAYVGAFALTMLVTFLVVIWFLGLFTGGNTFKTRANRFNAHIAGVVSFLCACLVVWKMMP